MLEEEEKEQEKEQEGEQGAEQGACSVEVIALIPIITAVCTLGGSLVAVTLSVYILYLRAQRSVLTTLKQIKAV